MSAFIVNIPSVVIEVVGIFIDLRFVFGLIGDFRIELILQRVSYIGSEKLGVDVREGFKPEK